MNIEGIEFTRDPISRVLTGFIYDSEIKIKPIDHGCVLFSALKKRPSTWVFTVNGVGDPVGGRQHDSRAIAAYFAKLVAMQNAANKIN